MSGSYQQGTANLLAVSANTNLAFAFREDPAYIDLSNVTMVDQTSLSGNLVVNGDFNGGTYPIGSVQTEPDGWDYLNFYNAQAAGTVSTDCGFNPGDSCYQDGSVGANDAINQVIPTTLGDTYQVSFYYLDTLANSTYEPTGTEIGRDMFVYAGDAAPVAAAPEPATLALFGAGLLGLGLVRRRRLR
jgi:hypothetical protein